MSETNHSNTTCQTMNYKLYNILTTLYPIILGALLLNYTKYITLDFSNIQLLFNPGSNYRLIALGFVIITFAGNLYSYNRNLFERIVGNVYCTASVICVLVEDLISMFIALEIMMLCSALLIFTGNKVFHKDSIRATRQYLLTHIFSGSLVLLGISYVIINLNSTKIINLTEFIHNKDLGFEIYAIMLTGILINIAAVPFSGWMVNCYPVSSNSGFIYLISFTTKVSIVLLIKLFAGFEALKIFGIIMLFYGGIYACMEINLKRLICYLSISQTGFIIINVGIHFGEHLIPEILTYILVHILYIGLLSLLIMNMFDENQITESTGIYKIKNKIVFVYILLGIFMITNMPLSASFLSKLALADFLPDIISTTVALLNISVFVALPIREYVFAKNSYCSNLKTNTITSFLIIFVALIIINTYLLLTVHFEFKDIIDQLIVITLGAVMCYIINITRRHTVVINFDLLHVIGNSFYHLVHRLHRKPADSEKHDVYETIVDSFVKNLSRFHNQKISIMAVFILLLLLVLMLNAN